MALHSDKFDLYLASGSPRRRELLEQIGLGYRTLSCSVDESLQEGERAEMYVLRLALAKAAAGRALLDSDDPHPVLGADTAVVIDDKILGKPQDREQALEMFELLSGRTHEVYSAVALVAAGDEPFTMSRLSVSEVTFRQLSLAEREAYWASGEPLDKAGGYAIQGAGARFVTRLEGSFSGVMGLPLYETDQLFAHYRRMR